MPLQEKVVGLSQGLLRRLLLCQGVQGQSQATRGLTPPQQPHVELRRDGERQVLVRSFELTARIVDNAQEVMGQPNLIRKSQVPADVEKPLRRQLEIREVAV